MKQLIFTVIAFASTVAFAADSTNTESGALPAQLSFVYPLGTNGTNAINKRNNVSVNIIAGINGTAEGIEIGGFVNVTKGYVKGVQIAGSTNVVTESVKGTQMAGLVNVCNQELSGGQFAGFVNFVGKEAEAIQGAGLLNVNVGNFKGSQFSGFANVNNGTTKGIQASSFLNVSVDSIDGGQFAGFANFSRKSAKGFFAAGFANIATGNLKGVQISGFLNVAHELNGFQIGVFNICDTVTRGVPVGFLSFVRNGCHKFEIDFGTDVSVLSFKTGVNKFYNILSVGAAIEDDKLAYGIGYGIGTNIVLSKKSSIGIDLIAIELHKGSFQKHNYDLLNKLKINYAFKIVDRLTVYGGPSLNLRVTELAYDGEGELNEMGQPLLKIYERTNSDNYLTIYGGFNVGIRF